MENRKELTYLIFDLIVKQLEETPEQDRIISRLEVADSALELTLKTGEEYRIDVKRLNSPSDEKERMPLLDHQREEESGKRIPAEHWDELAQSCETVIQFLEYDKRKMEELSELVPDFPWKKRSRMIDDVLEQLRAALSRIDPDWE
ncbi:hypothetical protein C8P63_11443 [Melghirimyces profundicolus]|uniref:Uncharacterized protein n=2 Tax=Melghirimyces profundicolus TaxID=1242148 RepID=A0A2T6BS13_9BACL|nr:hypothetical protein C8P63_11443 [Melghirimyces profundicolus]